jgi:hypothetical protein
LSGSPAWLGFDGIVEPMSLGHLPYKKAAFEDYVGLRGLVQYGKIEVAALRCRRGARPIAFNLMKWFLGAVSSRSWATFLHRAARATAPARCRRIPALGKGESEWQQSKTHPLVSR